MAKSGIISNKPSIEEWESPSYLQKEFKIDYVHAVKLKKLLTQSRQEVISEVLNEIDKIDFYSVGCDQQLLGKELLDKDILIQSIKKIK